MQEVGENFPRVHPYQCLRQDPIVWLAQQLVERAIRSKYDTDPAWRLQRF